MLPALPADALVRAELLRLCEQLRELSAPAGPRGLPARDEREEFPAAP